MNFTCNDRILIRTRMKNGDNVREARVTSVEGIIVKYEPATGGTHLSAGYGQFRTTAVGAREFGIQSVEVIGTAPNPVPEFKHGWMKGNPGYDLTC